MKSLDKYILLGDLSDPDYKKFYVRNLNTINGKDLVFANIEYPYYDSCNKFYIKEKRIEYFHYIKDYNYENLNSFSEFKNLISCRDNMCNDIFPEGFISKDPEVGKYTVLNSYDSDYDYLFLTEHSIDFYKNIIEICSINAYGKGIYINKFEYRELFSDSDLYKFVKDNFYRIFRHMKFHNYYKKDIKYPKNMFWEIFLDLKLTYDIFS